MKHRHMIWKLALTLMLILTAVPFTVYAESEPQKSSTTGIVVAEDGVHWREIDQLGIFGKAADSAERILAPGSKGTYDFQIKNTASEIRKIELVLEEVNQHAVPIEIRITADQEYIYGDANLWKSAADAGSWTHTMEAGKETMISLEWRWHFDKNPTEYDTYLGQKAVSEDLYYTLSLQVRAEESGSLVGDNPQTKASSTVKTGDVNAIWFYSILVIAGMSVLGILYGMRKKEKER